MQDFYVLHIEDGAAYELEALGEFSEAIMLRSGELGLPNWWELTDTYTRDDYIELQEIMGKEVDEEKANTYPEKKSFVHLHDEFVGWIQQLFRHLEANRQELKAYSRELSGIFGKSDFYGAPKNLKRILSDLKELEDRILASKEAGNGFYVEVRQDY